MTDKADPPINQTQQLPPSQPEPLCSMLAMCVECGLGIELPLPLDQRGLTFLLAQSAWFIAVLRPPSPDPKDVLLLGPLCTQCARQVYPPEAFAAAEQRRQQFLQAAAQDAHAQASPPQESR